MVRAIEVEISWKSLNHDDVFILDYKTHLYLWAGNTSNMKERNKML